MPEQAASASKKAREDRVRSLAEPVLAKYGAELIELSLNRGLVRIVADRPGGIDLGTCAKVSDEVARLLDAEDPIAGRYTLEVTSPGLKRPLKTAGDFRRNLGRTVRVVLARNQHEGVVKEVQEDSVTIATARGEVHIPLEDVTRAKLLLPW